MEVCAGCGHPLGASRFCTGCGQPVGPDEDWRTGTAERPAIRDAGPTRPPPPYPPTLPPTLPPPAEPRPAVAPPEPRYPLYADQVGAPPAHAAPGRPHRPWLPWLAVAIALVLMAVIGGLLLLRGDGSDATADDPAAGPPDSSSTPSDKPDDNPSETTTPTEPSGPGKPKRSKRKPPTPKDVTSTATVSAPDTAPPNQDVDGDLVRYDATNMLDDQAESCWRTPGDGTGTVILIGLGEPTEVSRVGLVNGYAKRSGDLNWYAGNRRVTDVEWLFDDGTTVAQSLLEERSLQTIDIEPVRTRTVRLRIVTVTAPGKGPAGRDFTPISELALVGTRT